MARASPLQAAFDLGEISPFVYGRIDNENYRRALARCENFVPMVQGPVTRRPGTKFVVEVKDSDSFTLLQRFEFSTTQAYVLEFGDLYVRFCTDHGQVVSGPPVEVVTPYTEAQLPNLRFVQSGDVLYIVHPSHAPRKLIRNSATSWTLTTITFMDGPYLPTNTSAVTLTPSATTGAITITASSATFLSTDVGRVVRILHGSTWGWARITAFTSTTQVSAAVGGTFGATTAQTGWRLGLWSATTGYPSAATFIEDRLAFSGSTIAPNRVDASKTGDYENFAPTSAAGAVASDNALSYTLLARSVNNVHWMTDNDKGIVMGTAGSEWILRPSTSLEALSPTNVSAKRATKNGCAAVAHVDMDRSIIYVQRGGRQIREFIYDFNVEGFRSPDVSIGGEHMTQTGIRQLAGAQIPQPTVWMVRNDGQLIGMTYDRDNDVTGWHRHILGGYSNEEQTEAAVVESVAVIPEPGGVYDEVWLVVRRLIGGVTKRYIEYFTKRWEDGDALEDSFYVDCGLTYDGAPATVITGLDHLEGQTVSILADGAVHIPLVVNAGSVTLRQESSVVHVGLPMASRLKTLPWEAGSADGTALGKTKRISRVSFWFMDTVGGRYGARLDRMNTIFARSDQDNMDAPPPLFSGQIGVSWDGGYDYEAPIWVEQTLPLPMTLIGIAPQLMTQDRA